MAIISSRKILLEKKGHNYIECDSIIQINETDDKIFCITDFSMNTNHVGLNRGSLKLNCSCDLNENSIVFFNKMTDKREDYLYDLAYKKDLIVRKYNISSNEFSLYNVFGAFISQYSIEGKVVNFEITIDHYLQKIL